MPSKNQAINESAAGSPGKNNQELKDAGLKVTVPRVKVLQILEQSENPHMSAEDIFKGLIDVGQDVGLATVYRVLTQFEKVGLVLRHNFDSGHSVYELANDDHHDHMVCIKCGDVQEFFDEEIEQRQMKIAEDKGFVVTEHSHYIYGYCAKCQ